MGWESIRGAWGDKGGEAEDESRAVGREGTSVGKGAESDSADFYS